MIDVERVDFVCFLTQDIPRAKQFYSEVLGFDTGVCHMAFFRDPDGNALMLHRRYATFKDGRTP